MKTIEIDFSKKNQVIEITEDSQVIGRIICNKDNSIQNKITFLHKLPNLKSRIEVKAVLMDGAKFDFEGLLKIDKGAVGSDSYLKIDCLLMSESAYARAIPSLEINESEVKGGHGATIGYLEPMQLFYLKSKGLSSEESEKLLVQAFLG